MYNTENVAELCIPCCSYGIPCKMLIDGVYYRHSCILCDDIHFLAFCMVLDGQY